jgi:hypothetical protein
LNQSAEDLFLQTFYTFIKYIIRRLRFFTQHRIDTHLLNSNNYQITNNGREQMRFLIELNKRKNGEFNHNFNSDKLQQKVELNHRTDEQQKREYRLSIIEELRLKEADQTACLVLRETRLKRQKILDNHQKTIPIRILRSTLQDLIAMMENETILRRSKTLLYAYANR